MAVVLSGLTLVPCLLLLGKVHGAPTSEFLTRHVTLTQVPRSLHAAVDDVVFVPLGALVVVLFRLTLGLRVLGPFRSILLAFAFVATGVVTGLIFLAATVTTLVLLRPLIRALRMPYFGRISVMLSVVALLIVLVAMAGEWLGSRSLHEVVRFPIVALCLVGDAVARTIRKEGLASGIWRTGMTALAAVIVATLASLTALRQLLLRDPELLLAEVALLIGLSSYGAWRLLERMNPSTKAARRKASASGSAEPTPLIHGQAVASPNR